MSPSKNSLEQIKEKELAIYYKSMYLLRLMGINPSKDSFKKFPVNQFALYLTNNALYGKIRGKGSIKISFNEEILVRITNAITNNSRITEEDRSEILKFSVSSRYIDSKECKLYCKVKDKLEKEIMIHEKDLNKGINQEIFNSIINFINSNKNITEKEQLPLFQFLSQSGYIKQPLSNDPRVLLNYKTHFNTLLKGIISHGLSIETYETYFKLCYEDLCLQNMKIANIFLNDNYQTTENIFISILYIAHIMEKSEHAIEKKYEILKKIVTDPLFTKNTPPRAWITEGRKYYINKFLDCGIRSKDFNFLENYFKTIDDKRNIAVALYHKYLGTGAYQLALNTLEVTLKSESREDKIKASLDKIYLLKKLNKDLEAEKLISKNIKNLLRYYKNQKDLVYVICGQDEEAIKILVKRQEKYLQKLAYSPRITTTEKPVRGDSVSTAPKKSEDVKKKKEALPINNNMSQDGITESILDLKEGFRKDEKRNELKDFSYSPINSSKEESRENKKEVLKLREQKKERVKTKGTSNPPQENNNNPPKHKTAQKQEKKAEEKKTDTPAGLTGQPLKTVYKLFRPFSERIGWDKLNISYAKIESLFIALKHKIGIPTGDHVKVTVNNEGQFDNNENNTNKENETMLTLVKKTKVCAAALEQIVMTFISYGIYPPEVEDTLRKKGLLPKKEN